MSSNSPIVIDTNTESESNPINSISEHLKAILITQESGTRAQTQNQHDEKNPENSKKPEITKFEETSATKVKRKERFSNPQICLKDINIQNSSEKGDLPVVEVGIEKVKHSKNLEEKYDSNPKTKLNYDYSRSGYKFREYKAPIVSFLDEDDYYGEVTENNQNSTSGVNNFPPLNINTENSTSSTSNSYNRYTNNTYYSKDISTIHEESQEFSELNQSSIEQHIDNAANYETPNPHGQQNRQFQNQNQLGLEGFNPQQYQQLSPVMEHRSAEDKFDSTGYIFHSRIGGSSFAPNIEVLEFQRSNPTSFDPMSVENVENELSKIRKRRATMGAKDRSVGSFKGRRGYPQPNSNILGSFDESDGGITPNRLSLNEKEAGTLTLRNELSSKKKYKKEASENGLEVQSPVSVHVKKRIPSVINSNTDRDNLTSRRTIKSPEFKLNLQEVSKNTTPATDQQSSSRYNDSDMTSSATTRNISQSNSNNFIFETQEEKEDRLIQSPIIEPNTIDIMNITPSPELTLTEDIDAAIFDSLQPEDKEKQFDEVENSWRIYQERETTDFCAEQTDSEQTGKNQSQRPSDNIYLSEISQIQISYPPAMESTQPAASNNENNDPNVQPMTSTFNSQSALLLPPSSLRYGSKLATSNRTIIESTITSMNIEASPNPTMMESRLNTIDVTSRISTSGRKMRRQPFSRQSDTSEETLRTGRVEDRFNQMNIAKNINFDSGDYQTNSSIEYDSYDPQNYETFGGNRLSASPGITSKIQIIKSYKTYQDLNPNEQTDSNQITQPLKSNGPYIPLLDIKNSVQKKQKIQQDIINSIQSIDITPSKMQTVATAFSRNFVMLRNQSTNQPKKVQAVVKPLVDTVNTPSDSLSHLTESAGGRSSKSCSVDRSTSKMNKWQERKLMNSKRNTLDGGDSQIEMLKQVQKKSNFQSLKLQGQSSLGIFGLKRPVISSSPLSKKSKFGSQKYSGQRSRSGNFGTGKSSYLSTLNQRSSSGSILNKKYALNNSQKSSSQKKVFRNPNFVRSNNNIFESKNYISGRRGGLNLLSRAKEVESRSITPQNTKYQSDMTPHITPKGPIFQSKTSEVNLSQIAQNLLHEQEEKDKTGEKTLQNQKSSATLQTNKSSVTNLRELASHGGTNSQNFFSNFNQKVSCMTEDDTSNGYTCVKLDSTLQSGTDFARSINNRLNLDMEIEKNSVFRVKKLKESPLNSERERNNLAPVFTQTVELVGSKKKEDLDKDYSNVGETAHFVQKSYGGRNLRSLKEQSLTQGNGMNLMMKRNLSKDTLKSNYSVPKKPVEMENVFSSNRIVTQSSVSKRKLHLSSKKGQNLEIQIGEENGPASTKNLDRRGLFDPYDKYKAAKKSVSAYSINSTTKTPKISISGMKNDIQKKNENREVSPLMYRRILRNQTSMTPNQSSNKVNFGFKNNVGQITPLQTTQKSMNFNNLNQASVAKSTDILKFGGFRNRSITPTGTRTTLNTTHTTPNVHHVYSNKFSNVTPLDSRITPGIEKDNIFKSRQSPDKISTQPVRRGISNFNSNAGQQSRFGSLTKIIKTGTSTTSNGSIKPSYSLKPSQTNSKVVTPVGKLRKYAVPQKIVIENDRNDSLKNQSRRGIGIFAHTQNALKTGVKSSSRLVINTSVSKENVNTSNRNYGNTIFGQTSKPIIVSGGTKVTTPLSTTSYRSQSKNKGNVQTVTSRRNRHVQQQNDLQRVTITGENRSSSRLNTGASNFQHVSSAKQNVLQSQRFTSSRSRTKTGGNPNIAHRIGLMELEAKENSSARVNGAQISIQSTRIAGGVENKDFQRGIFSLRRHGMNYEQSIEMIVVNQEQQILSQQRN